MGASRQPFEFAQSSSSDRSDAYRNQIKQAEEDRAKQRDGDLEAQVSPFKEPRERIEIWERIHALALPRARTHALVDVIARQTQLTIDQVRGEQLRRSGLATHV